MSKNQAKVATFVKNLPHKSWKGEARLYRLSVPLDGAKYVVVSASDAVITDFGYRNGLETFIFKADRLGRVRDWGELEGSFEGALDHAKALRNAGYVVRRG